MSVATVIEHACGGGPSGEAFVPLILEARKELPDALRFAVVRQVLTGVDRRFPQVYLLHEKSLKY